MSGKYTLTLHAIERAQHRLGVEPSEARRWINDTMRKAKYLFTQKRGSRSQAIYEVDDIQVVVDTSNHQVVTIKPAVDTSILTPIFEREGRRIKREVTRNTRRHERAIAELTVEMGERMVAYARARNPKTRELIQRDIDELQTKISGHETAITREQDRLTNFVKATEVYV